MSRKTTWLVLLALLLWVATAIGFYSLLNHQASRMVWDFYPLWRAGRWLLDGGDPYSDALTDQLQLESYGRLVQDQDPHTFAYPMTSLSLVLPLCLLPASIAQPVWLATLLWGLVWSVIGLAHSMESFRRPLAYVALLTWSLLLHPTTWGLLLGQPAIAATVLMTAALLALLRGRYMWAGVALAAASIKPQVTLLATLALFVWAVWQRRYRFLLGFGSALVLMAVVSFALHPGWVSGFVYSLRRYSDLMPFFPPVALMASFFDGARRFIQAILSTGLLIGAVWSWKEAGRRPAVPTTALNVSLVVTTLVIPRTSPVNHVILLLPLAQVLVAWWDQGGGWRWASAIAGVVALIAPWQIDVTLGSGTAYGSWHHAVFVSLLPVMTLLLLMVEWARHRAHRPLNEENYQ